ncbi:MAG: glycosyltransferase, partial [Actinomycetota bacterium]|nr:glycosyltransferase [Actinomycetota bacterium]
MHVLILPSWLAHPRSPVLGVFTLEQASAVAELRPDWRVSLVAWGQGELELAVRRPREWASAAVGRIRARPGRRTRSEGLTEYRQPALSWDPRLGGGNIASVARAALRGLRAAEAEHGAVDLIHAHVSVPAGQVAMRLKRATSIPYVLSEHWSAPPPTLVRGDGRIRDRLRAPHVAADATIAMSRAQAKTIEGWGVPR